jgi:hypothetical protein
MGLKGIMGCKVSNAYAIVAKGEADLRWYQI